MRPPGPGPAPEQAPDRPGIGQLNEKAVHASLKSWYARPGDRFEVPVGGHVIDIVRGELLIEIQTGSFSPLKSKLARLVRSHRVRLVHPILQETWILRPAGSRDPRVVRRKSPRRGRWEDVFRHMVSLPFLLAHRHFSLHVLMVRVEETRRYEASRRRRRGGWAVESRRLLEVVDQRSFDDLGHWRDVLPDGLGEFTTLDLAHAMGIDRDLAQKVAYCLRAGSVIEQIGARGNSRVYRVADDPPVPPP